jgi:hypothetical protein
MLGRYMPWEAHMHRSTAAVVAAIIAAAGVLAGCDPSTPEPEPTQPTASSPPPTSPQSSPTSPPAGSPDDSPGSTQAATGDTSPGGELNLGTPSPLPTPTISEFPSGIPTPSDSPSPTATKASAEVAMTYAAWFDVTRTVEAAGFATPLEAAGTCTLVLTKDGAAVTASVAALVDATSMACGGLAISAATLSPGDWTAVLEYDSPASHGVSAPMTVRVP